MTQHTSSENGLSVPAETEYTFSFARNGGNFSDELSSNGAEAYEAVRERIALEYRRPLMHSNGTDRAVPTGSGEPLMVGVSADQRPLPHGLAGSRRFLSGYPHIMRVF